MESYTQHWIELVSRWVRQVQAAEQVLRVSSGDVHRLQSAAERIRTAITEAQEFAHVGPTEESRLVLHHLESLLQSLLDAAGQASDSSVAFRSQPVTVEKSTLRGGRKRKTINKEWLGYAVNEARISNALIAKELGVSATLVRQQIVMSGIRNPGEPSRKFTQVRYAGTIESC